MELVYVRQAEGMGAAEAGRRAGEALLRLGYSPAGDGMYRRGTAWAGLLALSMGRLRTVVRIDADEGSGCRLTIRYDIDTFGQFVTRTNRRFWDVEVDDLLDLVRSGQADPARRAAYDADARRDRGRFLLVGAAVAAAGAAGIVALAWRLGGAAS